MASVFLLQDVGYVKEVKATEHPGRLDHPKGTISVGSPAVASAKESQIESALLLMSLTYESLEADSLLMPLHSGGKQGPSGAAVATHKAKWQGEIRAYTAHLHLTDGEMDMSEDLGYASLSRACDWGADLLATLIAACQRNLSATGRIISRSQSEMHAKCHTAHWK